MRGGGLFLIGLYFRENGVCTLPAALCSIGISVLRFLTLSFYIVDREIFVVKNFSSTIFWQKLNTRNILCNVCQPIPILVAEVWQRNLDYAKNLQVKYFTGENILIYGTCKLLDLIAPYVCPNEACIIREGWDACTILPCIMMLTTWAPGLSHCKLMKNYILSL